MSPFILDKPSPSRSGSLLNLLFTPIPHFWLVFYGDEICDNWMWLTAKPLPLSIESLSVTEDPFEAIVLSFQKSEIYLSIYHRSSSSITSGVLHRISRACCFAPTKTFRSSFVSNSPTKSTHRTSSTAGARTLGPSDALCSVMSSAAYGGGRKTLIGLVVSLNGPLKQETSPFSSLMNFSPNSYGPSISPWPRFVYIKLWPIPICLRFRYSNVKGRRHFSVVVSTSPYWLSHSESRTMVLLISLAWLISEGNSATESSFVIWPLWSSRTKRIFEKKTLSEEETIQMASSAEEDWKKAQVDSKKILAQPHQSATANLSRQGGTEEESTQEASSANEDWKKPQVESKKILAQPHQSATANPSRLIKGPSEAEAQLDKVGLTAIVSRKPPLHLIRLTEDILTLAKPFRDLSFRFIPRSQNFIADDLAKKAARSMTIGPPL